jgi:hypothetical protein
MTSNTKSPKEPENSWGFSSFYGYLALWLLNHWHIMYATMPAITDIYCQYTKKDHPEAQIQDGGYFGM